MAHAGGPPVYQPVGPYEVRVYHSDKVEYILGQGSFGVVYRAFNRADRSMVAAKKMTAVEAHTGPQRGVQTNELLPDTRNLNHPNIIIPKLS